MTFNSDERDKAGAQKRGGGKSFISLDETSAEETYLKDSRNDLSPDQIFDRRWAQTVMDRALSRLREEYVGGGKAELFDQLKEIQPGEHGESSYAEIGVRLGLAEGTVKSAVHRLRRRHRELLREEVGQTVGNAEEFARWMEEVRGVKVHVINRAGSRPVELRAAFLAPNQQLFPLFDETGKFNREIEKFAQEDNRFERRRRR